MSWTRKDRFAAALLAGAVLLQGFALIPLGQMQGRLAWQTLLGTVALAALVHQAWRFRRQLNHRADMALVMASMGGLGMLFGWWMDYGFGSLETAPGCPMRLGSDSLLARLGLGPAWSWMTCFMLAFAIPPSVAFTRCAELARRGWRNWVATHLAGNALMIVGMIWGGRWLGMPFVEAIGSRTLAHQLGMVAGMVIGMVAGTWLAELVLGLKPWKDPYSATAARAAPPA
jgi:hypothetical protein